MRDKCSEQLNIVCILSVDINMICELFGTYPSNERHIFKTPIIFSFYIEFMKNINIIGRGLGRA